MSKQLPAAEIRRIVNDMVTEMRECDDGAVISIGELVRTLGYGELSKSEWERLHRDLMRAAEENCIVLEGIHCDSESWEAEYNCSFMVKNKAAQIKCPFCGSLKTARIVYGYPMFDDKTLKKLDKGKIVLGGCCISGIIVNGDQVLTDPTRKCNSCKKKFGTPPLLMAEDTETGEDYRRIVRRLCFTWNGFFDETNKVEISRSGREISVHADRALNKLENLQNRQISLNEWRGLISVLFDRLFIHEWDHNDADSTAQDGTQWRLDIYLTRGRKKTISGCNKFPPYWNELKELFEQYL